MQQTEAEFLKELDKRLWTAADRLRSNLDAAVYKHVVLGLIFLKYVSDAFKERRSELEQQFRDPGHDYYLGGDEALIPEELEARDYYTEKNVFWVPALARWDFIQANAKVAVGTTLAVKNGKTDEYKFNGIGRLLDDALDAVEKDNPKLKNVLVKDYARLQIDTALPSLIDLIAAIPFHHESLKAKDILGHVYEYFLGEFAMAEGKKGGQYYTPKSIVTVIVEMLQPFKGRVYDPCCGSGGFFVQSEKFIQEHGGRIGQISVYGQESNPTTWRLASMNMAIRGMDFDFGKEPANSFTRDQHPDLRADFVMANPPFNMKEWKDGEGKSFDIEMFGDDSEEFVELLGRGKRMLLRLHGHCDRVKHRVVTKAEYDAAYDSERLEHLIRDVVFRKSLLFMGCSLVHDRLQKAMAAFVTSGTVKDLVSHFAIAELKDSDDRAARRKVLAEANIFPIWYPQDQHDEAMEALMLKLADGVVEL